MDCHHVKLAVRCFDIISNLSEQGSTNKAERCLKYRHELNKYIQYLLSFMCHQCFHQCQEILHILNFELQLGSFFFHLDAHNYRLNNKI